MKAGDFPKLKPKQYAIIQERNTVESKYWRSFNDIRELMLTSTPNCIHFNQQTGHDSHYIVTSSVKINLYQSMGDQLIKSYTRFNDNAYSGKYRKDGKLIVAGDKSGNVKVFDVSSKSVLREHRNHGASVRSTVWTMDGLHYISGSDDKKVMKYDLSTGTMVWNSHSIHNDYVRCVESNPTSNDLFVSGSYDHTVQLWDSRLSAPLHTISLDDQVECCLLSPSGAMLYTAHKNVVKVYDMIGGFKLLHTMSNHQKNITGLTFDGTQTRLLSCGLDGHLKFYSTQTFELVHGIKLGWPMVSVAMAPDNTKLVLGFTDGRLMIRNKNRKSSLSGLNNNNATNTNRLEDNPNDSNKNPMQLLSIMANKVLEGDKELQKTLHNAKYSRGTITEANQINIDSERSKQLQPFETNLKRFNYQLALDCALMTKNPIIVITLLEEICRRSGLEIALTGRNEKTLEPLLGFVVKYVTHPKYSRILIQVVERMLDIYCHVIGQSEIIDDLFAKLNKQVKQEVDMQKKIVKVLGSLDGIINASTRFVLPVELNDSQAIADMYSHFILNTSVTFEELPVSAIEIATRIESFTKPPNANSSFPQYFWLVYVTAAGDIEGYAYAHEWNSRSAYRFTAETSVYLKSTEVGKGIGTMLYKEVIRRLIEMNIRSVEGCSRSDVPKSSFRTSSPKV